MTELMEKAIAVIASMTNEKQNELASAILAANEPPLKLSPDEKKALAEGMADSDVRRFAPDEILEEQLARLRST